MRVLLSAFWCEPDVGSEWEIGYQALRAAASRHEVWLLTRADGAEAVSARLASEPTAHPVHVVAIPSSPGLERIRTLGIPGFHLAHDVWQRQAASRAAELDRRHDFDVVHHVTLAAYWTRAGAAAVDKPFVLGPVGGGVEPPLGLLPTLGPTALTEALARVGLRRAMARTPAVRQGWNAADLVLANNTETARRLSAVGERVAILPHGTAATVEPAALSGGARSAEILVVGRLVGWKAGAVALRAFASVGHTDARLRVVGTGPEQSRLRRLARRWGLEDRVAFTERLPRGELQQRLAHAGALLHPALHDESPLVAAEALQLGTPVVGLDRGGPRALAEQFPADLSRLVTPSTPARTAAGLAEGLEAFLADPPGAPHTPHRAREAFDAGTLSAYERVGRGVPA